MNLFLALVWLICAIALFAYEYYIGGGRSRIHVGNISFSRIRLMMVMALLLSVYNVWRWRRLRAYRLRQRFLEIDRANREWERRRRAELAGPPDPNFNFSDEPPPPSNRDITDQPPSQN